MKAMILPALAGFLFFLTTASTAQQVPVPKKCYMHLQGTIGKDLPAEMNLVRVNDTIFGEYSVSASSVREIQPGALITFGGKGDAKGNFTIKDLFNSKGSTFTGKFNANQSITGTFEPAPGKQRLPFDLKEVYSEGSVPMNVFFQQGNTALVKKPDSPTAHLSLVLLIPSESSNVLFSDTLKKIMLSKFTGKTIRNTNADFVLGGIREVYFEDYRTTNESIYKPGMGQSFSWELLKYCHVLMNRHNLLTFYVETYAFTGGAHGMQVRENTVVNLRNGRTLTLKDIMKPGYKEKLSVLLTEKARKMSEVEPGKSLKDAGFFVDEIEPSDNFYVTDAGIGFYYNHYEIAPYSFGPEDYFLPFSELSTIIDSNGALKELLR